MGCINTNDNLGNVYVYELLSEGIRMFQELTSPRTQITFFWEYTQVHGIWLPAYRR